MSDSDEDMEDGRCGISILSYLFLAFFRSIPMLLCTTPNCMHPYVGPTYNPFDKRSNPIQWLGGFKIQMQASKSQASNNFLMLAL